MGAIVKKSESMSEHALSQFELTSKIITKLNTFKLTPTAKLVLLYLTTCYNPKHREVFPKQKTIAIKLGVSEVSVTRAISELHKEGLIISERKSSNRYVFTSRILSEQPIEMINNNFQKDREETIKLISHVKEQKKEKINNKDDEYLKLYAQKRGVKNIPAYINAIKKNGGATQIIKEYKQIENKKRVLEKQTELMREKRIQEREQAVPPTEAWKALRNTIFKEYQ